MMTHAEYHAHLKEHTASRPEDGEFVNMLKKHEKELTILFNLNLNPVIPVLREIYSPVRRRNPRDPVCMLRSLILMTLLCVRGITAWVAELRTSPVLAVLCGFVPGDTPGVGTYYDFMKRIADGPYRKPCEHVIRRSEYITGSHLRNLSREKEMKKENRDPHNSQSAELAEKLLAETGRPRKPDIRKICEDLLILTGVVPSAEAGLLSLENMTVSGDGSVFETAASPHGKPACDCRENGVYGCGHDRYYSTPTAEFCRDAVHGGCKFGDRYYHIVTAQNGHDFPLITIMPGGNESDYTLSLKACDRLPKAAAENGVNLSVSAFAGDGHHDSYAHYDYFAEKDIVPFIPLSEKSKNAFPHLPGHPGVRFNTDGTPLCPAGVPMRHHLYNKKKRTHVYSCPAKRSTHRGGKSLYVMHTEDCPLKKDCQPGSSTGPSVYVKNSDDPRLFPPVPRGSRKFKEIMNQRTASERCNFIIDTYNVEKSCRNADYGLIRLTLANIAHHANIRYAETVKNSSPAAVSAGILRMLRESHPLSDTS